MATPTGAKRASLLTRSWLLTPACVNYRAGKCSRHNTADAYQKFPETAIQRNPSPYTIRPRRYHSSAAFASTSSAIPHITYHIAASASGKGRKFRPGAVHDFEPQKQDALGIQQGDSKPGKRGNRPDSGQDAFFVAKIGAHPGAISFGIADGVGGWANQGVDPADFSHGLCSYMARAATSWSDGHPSPRKLLEMAYQNTIEDPEIKAGGSTACVGIADADGNMQIANLGDSGFLQLRLGAVHHYSNPQTHAFNTPYQLSITPPYILAQSEIFGGAPLHDLPDKAEIADHHLQHGDVLILATDGVWDNLNSQDVLGLVSAQMQKAGAWKKSAQEGFIVTDRLAALTHPGGDGGSSSQTLQGLVASAVAGEAKHQSMNSRRDGPFAREVQKNYPEEGFRGGKVDDICVIALIPVEREDRIRARL